MTPHSMQHIGPAIPDVSSSHPTLSAWGKASLGLPPESEATPKQKRDGMCWRDPNEPYNGGNAFKICCRDRRGVMVTIIADNYYGYCKKEVKTQISFSANLYGLCEEEHAGGAMASAAYVLGQDFYADHTISLKKTSFEEGMDILGGMAEPRPGRYAVDVRYPDILTCRRTQASSFGKAACDGTMRGMSMN